MLKPEQRLTTIKLLSIDPGLNNTGIAEYTLELLPEFKIVSIVAYTLSSTRLIDDSGFDDDDVVERIIKRHKLQNALSKTLDYFKPDVAVCESPFFNPKMPSSFAALTEVVSGFFDTILSYNPRCSFHLLAPKFVKRVFNIAGLKGKDVVKEAVSKVEDLMLPLQGSIESLDEHAIDGIAIGYAWIKEKTDFMKRKE